MRMTRPDEFPIASVDAITADTPGRYAGGSHSTLCKPQVTHTPSLNPMPFRSSRGRPDTSAASAAGSVLDVLCDDGAVSGG